MEYREPERPRLPALTSVRFFAALWVALFHMQAMQAFHFRAAAVRQFASIGYAGVSFFFVLSGFILVYTYSGRSFRLRDFWQSRFARIYPALAFSLLVTAPTFFYCLAHMRAHDPKLFVPEWAWVAGHPWISGLLSVTLLESWFPQTALAWNMPSWSLSAEAFFYLIFPFLLPRMMRLSQNKLLALVPAGFFFTLGCALAYTHIHPDGGPQVTTRTLGPWINFLKFHPLIRLPEFVMGMATGTLFLRYQSDRRWAWPLVGMGVTAVFGVVLFSHSIPYLVIHTALLAPAFAVLVYGLALRPTGTRLLDHPVFEALGEASYPFYLLHTMVMGAFFMNWRTGETKHQSALGFAAWLLIAVAVSVLVDRGVERPLRRLLRPRRARVAAAPALVTAQG